MRGNRTAHRRRRRRRERNKKKRKEEKRRKRKTRSVSFKGAVKRASLKRASLKLYVQDLLFRIYICKIICSIIYLGYVLHILKMQYFLLFNGALMNAPFLTAPLLK